MKTTLVKFPHEPMAVLQYGEHRVEMSPTYIHHLLQVLIPALKSEPIGNHTRDDWELSAALEKIMQQQINDTPRMTPEIESQTLARYHERGYGFWSSWMPEVNPYAGVTP